MHALRAGVELRFKDNELVDITRRTPAYTFTGQVTGKDIADLLLGLPPTLSATTSPVIEWRQQAYSGFLQDDWKVRPDLTLNLGLRYEYTTPYYGGGVNKNINFDFNTGQLVSATDDDKYLMGTDRNNFAPRVGVAWQARPERLVAARRLRHVLFDGGDARQRRDDRVQPADSHRGAVWSAPGRTRRSACRIRSRRTCWPITTRPRCR